MPKSPNANSVQRLGFFEYKSRKLAKRSWKLGIPVNPSTHVTAEQLQRLYLEYPNCPKCGHGMAHGLLSMYERPEQKHYWKSRIVTIDRRDETKGYTKSNVQILCGPCNWTREGGRGRHRRIEVYRPMSEWHEAARGLWYPDLIWDLGLVD